ncbi:carboxypeptidase-like regulatory domain-containing protein [Tamlana crocina]
MKRLSVFLLFNVLPFALYGQSIELSGRVSGATDVENIHVINKTQQLFTITDKNGRFNILAKLNDTLAFSSIQHQPKEVVVSGNIIKEKVMFVFLEEQINKLDEVVVGKVLTGNLMSDIENFDGNRPINFFDVGIPGYTGKPATQSERRLAQAGEFKPIMLLGLLGGSMPLDPLINTISGRTKMLKNRVELEEREALMQRVKSRLAKDFFLSNPLDDDLKMDFFYFCADDEHFIKYCKNKTDFEILIFLRKKYRQYKENLSTNKK